MAVQGGVEEDVYATLLLSDTYLPGALVLAHSLRDAGTIKKLAVLVTLDSVSAEAIDQLKTVYHYVFPVSRIQNTQPANLNLMNRADLHSAFTKINLWKMTEFRKIVYIDADVVAYRAPDELFDIPHPFSAAPDIGWPDLFNTGVMVLTPNMGDYYAMRAMAERNISFDGADQGLMNLHFGNSYNRISFTYNVTPSAHYQYVPAYRHFQSSINMVHFIGSDKPWFQGRYASTGSSPFDEMIGRWWAVYDRHYRVPSPQPTRSSAFEPPSNSATTQAAPEFVQYLTKGEYQPKESHYGITGEPYNDGRRDHENHIQPTYHSPAQYHEGHHEAVRHHRHDAPQREEPSFSVDQHPSHVESQPGPTVQEHEPPSSSFAAASSSSFSNVEGTQAEAREEQVSAHQGVPPPPQEQEQEQKPAPAPFQPTMSSWDAQRHAPPSDAKPEAMNFPATVYEMSQDAAPFVAPVRYPSPPKNMWYEVPKERPAPPTEKPKPIFPWETSQPQPTRVFADEPPKKNEPENGSFDTPAETSTVEPKSEPATPTTPTIHITPSDPWTSYTRTNAWDDVPEIERYVDNMQKHRRSRSLKSPGVLGMPSPGEGVDEIAWRRHGNKLTDFPSETERPSLPVTPAPIRRPKFWGGGGPGISEGDDSDPLLPAAEGVPRQSEWDPVAQLQKLAKQQSEVLLQKLGGGGGRDSSDLPPRPLPFGSEELISPTYVAHSAHHVVSPQPVKGSASSGPVASFLSSVDANFRGPAQPTATVKFSVDQKSEMSKPSYSGPGPAFEKGESLTTQESPPPPLSTEE